MGDLINQIWKFVRRVSGMSGLVCFALSSTYKKSFGTLGIGGLVVYLSICSIMWCLMSQVEGIRVSEKVQGFVGALIFVVISVISVVLDKLMPGKSDALSIVSYGSFALMSLSMSRKLELGFETGFSAFFLQLFAAQLFKIKWFLLPIALLFCSLIIILRHSCAESGVQPGPLELGLLNADVIDVVDYEDSIDESRYSSSNGEVSEESLLSRNNQQNSEEEETGWSSPATPDSPGDGEVSGESTLDGDDNEHNNEEEEDPSSLPAVGVIYKNTPDSPGDGEVSGESTLDGDDNEHNNEEEEDLSSLPAVGVIYKNTPDSPGDGEVSGESTLDGDNEHNNEEEEDPSSLPAESSANNSFTRQIERALTARAALAEFRRRKMMKHGITDISSSFTDDRVLWGRKMMKNDIADMSSSFADEFGIGRGPLYLGATMDPTRSHSYSRRFKKTTGPMMHRSCTECIFDPKERAIIAAILSQ